MSRTPLKLYTISCAYVSKPGFQSEFGLSLAAFRWNNVFWVDGGAVAPVCELEGRELPLSKLTDH